MARSAVAMALLLLGAATAEDAACPDGVCPAEYDEEAALLQKAAQQKATTAAPYCTGTPGYTCGNPSRICVMDPVGCTPSGGGVCCKAAGNQPGMNQCRFCDGDCAPCSPSPSPTPAPPTTAPTPRPPSPSPTIDFSCSTPGYRGLGERCMFQGGVQGGPWYGCCAYPFVCTYPTGNMAGAYKTCQYATMQPYR